MPGFSPRAPAAVNVTWERSSSAISIAMAAVGNELLGRFTINKGAEYHKKAAEHHELAAKHHREAAKHHEAGSHEKAAHHSEIAAGHGLTAVHHTEEATKHHPEEHTEKGTTATLTTKRDAQWGRPVVNTQN